MACREWIPRWISHLYGEATEDEAREVERHLEHCEGCRADYDSLLATRRLMAAHAPQAPPAPPVLLLSRPPRIRPSWAFAAGVVLTALVSVVSFRMGAERTVGSRPTAPPLPVSQQGPIREEVHDWARQAVDRRLDEWSVAQAQSRPAAKGMTRDEFEHALAALSRRVEQERRSDLDFVMARIAASDQRTEGWMDDTQRALQYVTFAGNPGISPR